MPIKNLIIHLVDKKPDGSPAALHLSDQVLPTTDAIESMLFDLGDTYNSKQGKAWGFFHPESGAYPLTRWLNAYLDGQSDFVAFTREASEHLSTLR